MKKDKATDNKKRIPDKSLLKGPAKTVKTNIPLKIITKLTKETPFLFTIHLQHSHSLKYLLSIKKKFTHSQKLITL